MFGGRRQMADIRLLVTLNGRELCRAGMDEHGTVSATVELNRLPGVSDPLRPVVPPPVEEHHALRVEGQTWKTDDALRWAVESLQPGDEIVIRVLGPRLCDHPAERVANEIF
jgi:hypothetical protein